MNNYKKQWYINNRERLLKKSKENKKLLSKISKKSHTIKYKYGINIEEYNIMLEKCNNKCEICGKLHTEELPLNIDHDHITNKIRGLLCKNCNFGLGNFKDNILNLENALKYLKNEV